MKGTLQGVARVLLESQRLLVTSHIFPDGDCIGSTLALAEALRGKGIEVTTYNGDPVPQSFRYLPGAGGIIGPGELGELPETVVLVDCSDTARVGEELYQRLGEARQIINIDHHVSNSLFGLALVDPKAPAAGLIVYNLLGEMAVTITTGMATSLYTALVTDTGSFQYENTNVEAHRVAAELVAKGADLREIRFHLWESNPMVGYRLLALALGRLEVAACGQVAWITLSQADMLSLGACDEHCNGLVDYPRSIEGVEVGIFFREVEPGLIKVGLRSKSRVDVNKLAARFGGGGHQRAAGCEVGGLLPEVVEQVVAAAREAVAH